MRLRQAAASAATATAGSSTRSHVSWWPRQGRRPRGGAEAQQVQRQGWGTPWTTGMYPLPLLGAVIVLLVACTFA